MPSLADLSEVIGFFSYSREDDEAYKGRLSGLRESIQEEVSALLGRSKSTFRLWQDKEAIAPGKLWESEIRNAVEQSVFFVPIVTPRMVNSQYCQLEFDAFLARERALGRSDLVFPILYLPVPALANEAQWRNHPVLSAIARRQYVDWQTFRYVDVPTPAMREEIARFCRKIVDALHESWLSPEERRQQEEIEARRREEEERHRRESAAQRRAEEELRRQEAEEEAQRIAEERRRQEAEAKLRVSEAERQQHAEAESQRCAEQERRAREAEAEKRKEDEQAFVATKAADTVSALNAFLAAHPASPFAAEARALCKMLAERYDAYEIAISSNDPSVLRGFIDHHPSGKLTEEVRSRLRDLEPRKSWRPSRRAMLVGGAGIAAGVLAGALVMRRRRDESLRTFVGHTQRVWSVAFAPDGRTALSASSDGTIRRSDVATGSTSRIFSGSVVIPSPVAFTPDAETAVSIDTLGKSLTVWDLVGGRIRTFTAGPGDFSMMSIAVAPDGRTALCGGMDGIRAVLKLWDLIGERTVRILAGDQKGGVFSVAFSSDGHTSLSGYGNGTLTLWDVASGDPIRTIAATHGAVEGVAMSRDGRTALSADNGGVLELWNLTTGSTIHTLSGPSGNQLVPVAIAPDGRTALAPGPDEATVRLWNLGSGQPIRTFTGHTETVNSLAFSPDGRTALSGGEDNTLKLWNLA